MAKETEIALSLDYVQLYKDIADKAEAKAVEEKKVTPRSTVFSLGSDPRVGTRYKAGTPTINRLEIHYDRMDNPYIRLKWRLNRSDIDSGGVVGFGIFRRKLTEIERVSLGSNVNYDKFAFDRLSRSNKRTGRFSEDRKAIYNIRRGATPSVVLNENLDALRQVQDARVFDPNVLPDAVSPDPAEFERFIADKDFENIGYVDYSFYTSNQKAKFEDGVVFGGLRFDSGGTSAQTTNRDFVELTFDDIKVGLQEGFEYYVASITKEVGAPLLSNFVKVLIENLNEISPPVSLQAKQISESSIQLSISCEQNDDIAVAVIYRKADDEILFRELTTVENITDTISYVDTDVLYSKTYTYRVILVNIHGVTSLPREVTVFSSAQRLTANSRSNNLKIPIILATQDQNSDFVRIAIFPNDPNIAYYTLKRRDLSIHEKKFSVPSKLETNYGLANESGWDTNQFFVKKEHEAISDERTRIVFEEIVFLDKTVTVGHIYQYQVRGYDLFGNGTSYSLSTVKVEGKKSLRAPINLRAQVIRGFPYRTKISWEDDNLAALTTFQSVFSDTAEEEPIKIAYLIQRRKLGETAYETFPLTANNFVIDEVICPDPIKFQPLLTKDDFTEKQENIIADFDVDFADRLRRSFKLPNFLKDNDVYYYRVAAVSALNEQSNFSPEFEVKTLQDLSDPINFQVAVDNAIIFPSFARLTWEIEELKARPDHWVIERRVDSPTDSFKVVGRAYLDTVFLDKKIIPGNQYIYRIKSVDVLGRQSNFFEARLAI